MTGENLAKWRFPRGVLLEIFGRDVPPGSPTPDPVSGKKMSFSTPVFRPDLQNQYPFSDLAFRQKLCHHILDQSANKTCISNLHISKISKVYTRFQTKKAQKQYPFGGGTSITTYVAYIRE